MSKAVIFFAPGLEECEGLLCVDLLRRSGVEVTIAAVGGEKIVKSARSISVVADALAEELDYSAFDAAILPGGIPGVDNLKADATVRKVCTVPLIVKLSPQAESIPEMCKAVEAAGADAISLTNTFQACAIDLEKRRPVFNNIFAGLSGPAVRPIALRMVWQAVGAVNIPVVGLGGIATGRDALEFIMAGATAVQVGAANFANPRAMETIADEMAAWMDKNGVKTLDEIRGCARHAE